ncbi:hypothetical protein ACLOJK_007909 [Asimina triloba]
MHHTSTSSSSIAHDALAPHNIAPPLLLMSATDDRPFANWTHPRASPRRFDQYPIVAAPDHHAWTNTIDAPGGFLFEWWSVFWDIFIARTNEKHSEVAAAYIEAQQLKAREQQQQLQMQQLQLIQQRHAQMQRRDATHPSLSGPITALNSDGMLGQSTASVLAAKMYEERMKHPHSMDSETSPQLLDASRMALLKSASNHPGQLAQGNPGSVSVALQQIQGRTQQTTVTAHTLDLRGSYLLSSFPFECLTLLDGFLENFRTLKVKSTWVLLRDLFPWIHHQFMDQES